MPIVNTGEWWNQNARPILKARPGAVSADVEQADMESCAVSSGAIAASAVTCGHLAAGAITCAAMTCGHVASCHASDNLLRRSYALTLPDPAKGVAYATTCMIGWSSTVPVQVKSVKLFPLTAWAAVTSCGSFQAYSTGGSLFEIKACTTGYGPAGKLLSAGALTNVALAAGADLQFGLSNLNACDDVPAMLVQIDYETTG